MGADNLLTGKIAELMRPDPKAFESALAEVRANIQTEETVARYRKLEIIFAERVLLFRRQGCPDEIVNLLGSSGTMEDVIRLAIQLEQEDPVKDEYGFDAGFLPVVPPPWMGLFELMAKASRQNCQGRCLLNPNYIIDVNPENVPQIPYWIINVRFHRVIFSKSFDVQRFLTGLGEQRRPLTAHELASFCDFTEIDKWKPRVLALGAYCRQTDSERSYPLIEVSSYGGDEAILLKLSNNPIEESPIYVPSCSRRIYPVKV